MIFLIDTFNEIFELDLNFLRKNKSTNLNLSPLDIKTSENYCGDNFDVSSNNTGAITSQCPSKIKKPSSKYSAFDKAKLEKQLKDTVVAN